MGIGKDAGIGKDGEPPGWAVFVFIRCRGEVVAVGGGEINLAAQNFKPMRLYAVTVLRAHNSTKGRRKAADRKIYVLGRDALGVKDMVERGKSRVPGIKCVLSVIPLDIKSICKTKQVSY